MSSSSRFTKVVLVIVTALLILSFALAALPARPAFAATQYIGGRAVLDDLRIQVLDNGRIGVERWTGSAWERQIYGTTSKGSRFQYSGGSMGLGYFQEGGVNLAYNTSNYTVTGGVKTWTAEAKWGNGVFDVAQTITYREGDPYFKLNWKIFNVSGSSKSDLRFFHGEDTYLRNGDNGAGWVDWGNYTIGVKKNVGTEQRMSLQGISPLPYAYQSNNYSSVGSAVRSGALTNTIDPNEATDNGYALEWRTGSLAANATWEITAYEKFNNVTIGSVQVMAPVAKECAPGQTCDLLYTVKNPGSSPVNVNLSYTTAGSSWTVSPSWPGGSSNVTVNGGASVPVTLRVTLPAAGVTAGSMMEVTLYADPTGSGATASETAAVNALVPANQAPTSLLLNNAGGPVSVRENSGTNATVGTLSGSDPDGDSLTYSLVGGDTGAFNISGSTLRATNSFNYEARTSYSVTVRASDGKGGAYDRAFTVNVTNQNETPSLAAAPAQSTAEDTALNLTMTASDPDNITNRLAWSIGRNGSLGTAAVSGTGASKTITYTPSANQNGADSFVVRVTGEGGTYAEQTVQVTISAVNDAPANAWEGGAAFPGSALSLRVDQPFSFDAGSIAHIPSLLAVADVDAATLQVTLSVTRGTLALSGTAGLTGDTNGADGTLQVQGTIAAVNAALKGLIYTPPAGATGSDTLTLTTSDLGVAGSGGTRSDTDTVSLAIANPSVLVVGDTFRGDTTPGWGYDHFTRIEDALAAARAIDATNPEEKPVVTIQVNGGSYLADSVTLDNPRLKLQLLGAVRLGGDLTVSAGVLDPNGQTLTFATGAGSRTHHVLTGAAPLHNLAVEAGNTLEFAAGAQVSLGGTLSLAPGAVLDALADPGRTTLALTGSGERSLPAGLALDHLVIGDGVTFQAPASLALHGDLTNSGAYDGSGTLIFAAPAGRPQTVRGSAPQLHGVTIAAGSPVLLDTNLLVSGDWSDQGALDANGHSVTFNGDGDQAFSGTSVFADALVGGASRLALAAGADFGYTGAFSVADGGAFDASAAGSTVRLAGSQPQTLPAVLTTLHHLAINEGAVLDATNRALSLAGDLTNLGQLDQSGGSLTFAGAPGAAHAIHTRPQAVTQFGSLTLADRNALTPDADSELRVRGDWTDLGTFQAQQGVVVFNGSAQTFTGQTVFEDVTIAADATLTLAENADFGYRGVFTRAGAFQPLAANTTVRLAGPGEQALPAGVDELVHLAIDEGATLVLAGRDLTLRGDLRTQGGIRHTDGLLTFAAPGSHTLTVSPAPAENQLASLAVPAGAQLATAGCDAANPLAVSDDWTVGGEFDPGQCKVIFNGAGSQSIQGTGVAFYDLEIANTAPFPNDETQVSSQNAITVSHQLVVLQGQFQPKGGSSFADVVLGGTDASQAGILRPRRGETLLISGDWERRPNGWFDANAGVVQFTGAGDRLLKGGATFYTLQIAKDGGALESTAPVTVDNLLTVSAGRFSPSANSKFRQVEVAAQGTLKPVGNINISGHLTNAGAYVHNGKSVTFDGAGTQELRGRVEFYNLTINQGSTLQLRADSVLGYAGAFVLNGALDATSFPRNTVEVMGVSFQQTLPAVTVNNLTLKNRSSLKLRGDLTVTGDLLVENGAAFDPATYTVHFANIPGSTPSFAGSATFGNVEVAAPAELTVLANANLRFTGAISGGALQANAGGATVSVAGPAATMPDQSVFFHLVIEPSARLYGGDGTENSARAFRVAGNWTNDGAFDPQAGSVEFFGGAAQAIAGQTAPAFHHLLVNKAEDTTLTAGVVTTSGALSLSGGVFAPDCGSVFDSVVLTGGFLQLAGEDCAVAVREDWDQSSGGLRGEEPIVQFIAGADASHAIRGAAAGLHGLEIADGQAVTLAADAHLSLSGWLAYGEGSAFSAAQPSTLVVNGDLAFPADVDLDNLTVGLAGVLHAPHAIMLSGSFTNTGSFDNQDGSLTFTGGGVHNLETTNATYTRFGDLTVADAGDTLRLGGADDAAEDAVEVWGDFINHGAFDPNQGTVTFKNETEGAVQKILGAGAENLFHHLIIDTLGSVASRNADDSDFLPVNLGGNLEIRRGRFDVPSGSTLQNVLVYPGGTIGLPALDDTVTVNGAWDNQGAVAVGGSTNSLTGSFYVVSAVVNHGFGAGTPGFGFDKFDRIADALAAAQEDVYVQGAQGEDPALTYAETVVVNDDNGLDSTSHRVHFQGKAQIDGLTLTNGAVGLDDGALLALAAYNQDGGIFNLASGTLELSGAYNQTGGAFHGDTGTLAFTGSAAQSITIPAEPGSANFNNLAVRNTADPAGDASAVQSAAPITVAGTLSVEQGQFTAVHDSHFGAIAIGEHGIFKIAAHDPQAVVFIDGGGALTRHASGMLNLNGGRIDGYRERVVTVQQGWDASVSGFGFDSFAAIPDALAANPDVVRVLAGEYPGFTLNQAVELQIAGAVTFTGALDLQNGALSVATGQTLTLRDDLSLAGDQFLTGDGKNGAVRLNGGEGQQITGADLRFYDLAVETTGLATTGSPITISNTLTITAGQFQPACGSVFENVSLQGGELIADNAACSFTVHRNWQANGGAFVHHGAQVVFDGDSTAISGDGAAFGSLTVPDGARLTAPAGTLVISGALTAHGDFDPGTTGSVVFTGQPSKVNGADLAFNDLTINPGSQLQAAAPGLEILVKGDWNQDTADQFLPNQSIVTFNGATDQTIHSSSGEPVVFYALHVDKSAGALVANPALDVSERLEINSGTLELHHDSTVSNESGTATGYLAAGATLTLIDEVNPTDGTTLRVDNWTSDGGAIVPNHGGLIPARIASVIVSSIFDTDTPGFGIDHFQTLADALSKDYLAENAQVHIQAGTYDEDVTVSKPVRLMADGAITLGKVTLDHAGATLEAPTGDGEALTLLRGLAVEAGGAFVHNDGALILDGAVPQSLPNGITVHDLVIASGARLDAPAALTVRGSLSNQGGVFNGSAAAITFAGPDGAQHTLTGSFSAGSITVSAGNRLALNASAALALHGGLTLADGASAWQAGEGSTFTAAGTTALADSLTVWNLAVLPDAALTAEQNLTVRGSLAVDGTFTPQATVILSGTAAQSISSAAGRTITFENLTIDDADDAAGANDVTASARVNVTGTLRVSDGRYAPEQCGAIGALIIGAQGVFAPQTGDACAFTVSGDWTNHGQFTAGGSVMRFTGSAAQSIGGTADTLFAGLEIANTGSQPVSVTAPRVLSAASLVVEDGEFAPTDGSTFGSVEIGAGATLTAPTGTLNITGPWENLGEFQAQGGRVRFSVAGQASLTGTTEFYDLEAADGAEIHLASQADVTVHHTLQTNTTGAVSGAPDSTLRLLGAGPAGLPTSAVLGSLVTGPDVVFTAPDLLDLRGDLTIQGGFTAGAELRLGGGLTLATQGSFDAGAGIVRFNGAAAQTLNGRLTFHNLEIDTQDPAHLTLAENARVTLLGDLTAPNSGRMDGSAAGARLTISGGGTRVLPGGLALHDLVVGADTTVQSPGGLSLAGDLTVHGAFNSAGGSVTFNGPNPSLHLLTGEGDFTFGTLAIAEGSTLTPQEGMDFAVQGSWNNQGAFVPNGSEVIFNGATQQMIFSANPPQSFAHLTVDNPLAVVKGLVPVDVDGSLRVLRGVFQPFAGSTFTDVAIGSQGQMDGPAGTISVSGGWSNAGAYQANSGTVAFTGPGEQALTGDTTFGSLEIGGGSTLVLAQNANLGYTGGFTIAEGGALDAMRAQPTTVTVAGSAQHPQRLPDNLTLRHLTVAGGAELDGSGTTVTLHGDLTADGAITGGLSVIFAGQGDQALNGAGPVALGDVAIHDPSRLVPAADRAFSFSGDWTNDSANQGGFAAGSSHVTYTGTGAHTLGGETITTFNDLTVGSGTLSGPVVVNGQVEVAAGAVFQPANGAQFHHVRIDGAMEPEQYASITVSGNWIDDGAPDAGFLPNNGTVLFNSDQDQAIGGSHSPARFSGLTIANPGVITPSVPLAVEGDLRLEEGGGTLILPDQSSLHNVTINPGATLQLVENGHFSLTGSWSNQGTYNANGGGMANPVGVTPSIETVYVDPATCTATPGACGIDRFADLQSAVDQAARDGQVIVLPSAAPFGAPGQDALALPADKPVRLVFQGGADDVFTILGNVTQNGGTLIAPEGVLRLAGNLAFTGGAFNPNGGVVSFTGSGPQDITGDLTFATLRVDDADDAAGQNLVRAAGALTVTGKLDIADGVFSPAACGEYAAIEIGAAGELAPQSGAACINLSGNWTNNGAYTHNQAVVSLSGSAAQVIGGEHDSLFGGLTIANTADAAAVTVQTGRSIQVEGELQVNDGRFEAPADAQFHAVTIGAQGTLRPTAGATITLTGAFANQGAFQPNGGTVVLAGEDGQALSGTLAFHNLEVALDAAEDAAAAGSPLSVSGLLRIASGELRLPTGSQLANVDVLAEGALAPAADAAFGISGSWTNAGRFEDAGSTVTFNGAGPQQVTGVAELANVIIDNTAAPAEACANAAACNDFYDEHDVEFGGAVTIREDLVVSRGQFQPLSGTRLTDVSIEPAGRVRGKVDADPETPDTLDVSGMMTNHGLFDLNGLSSAGSFAVTQVYVSSEYDPASQVGFGMDHFNTIGDALAYPGVSEATTITVYGGTYAEDVTLDQPRTLELVGHSAITLLPDPVVLRGSLTLAHPDAEVSIESGGLQLTGGLDARVGTFDAGQGEVVFAGDGLTPASQLIRGAVTFYDLSIFNQAAQPDDQHDVEADAAITVQGQLTVAAGQFSPNACSRFAQVEIGEHGILRPHSAAACPAGLQVTGDWTNLGGQWDPNGALLVFAGTQPQTIAGETGLVDVVIRNPAGVSGEGHFTSTGTLTIEAGTLTLPEAAEVHDVRITDGAGLALPDGSPMAYLVVTGSWTDENPTGGFAANDGIVVFDGVGPHTFTGASTFHNLIVEDGDSLTLAAGANLGFSGDLILDGGLDATSNPDTTLTVAHSEHSPAPQTIDGASSGALTLNNLVIADDAALHSRDTELTLTGDFTNDGVFGGAGLVAFANPNGDPQTIAGSGSTHFNDLRVDGELVGEAPVFVDGALTIPDGGLFQPAGETVLHTVLILDGGTLDGADRTLHVTGDWINQGDFLPGEGSGVVIFDGSQPQTITGETTFDDLRIVKTDASGAVTVVDPLTVTGGLVVEEGQFVQVQSGSTFNTVHVENGGTLVAEDGATDISVNQITFDPGSTFSTPGGVFKPSNILWAATESGSRGVAEKPAGREVGQLKTVDLNLEPQEQFTYAFANDENCGPDNDLFSLRVTEGLTFLDTRQPLDYETRAAYTVCLRTTDPTEPAGLWTVRTLRVVPADANDEPVISQDGEGSARDGELTLTTQEGVPLTAAHLTLTASDQDRDAQGGPRDSLTWRVTEQPGHGTLTQPHSAAGGSYALAYRTTAENWNGADAFSVAVSDGAAETTLRVNVIVQPVNDPPVNVQAPRILNGSQVNIGDLVQSTSGEWNDNNDPEAPGAISVSYQWQRADNAQGAGAASIAGAASSSYVAAAQDQGRYIRVVVTARDSGSGQPASASASAASPWVFVPGRAPTDITLSSRTVAEQQPAGTLVGALSAADPDPGDVFTYALVVGEGSQDNAAFAIDGDRLLTARVLTMAEQAEYRLRVRATDGGGSATERAFTVQVVGSQVEVSPKEGGEIVIPGDGETPGTTIEIPVGSVLDPTTLIFVPQPTVATVPNGMVFGSYAFDLVAYQNGAEVKDFAFNKPVLLTVGLPASLSSANRNDSLTLMAWNGAAWEAAACGDATLDAARGTLQVPVCKVGQFALFAEASHTLLLPMIFQ